MQRHRMSTSILNFSGKKLGIVRFFSYLYYMKRLVIVLILFTKIGISQDTLAFELLKDIVDPPPNDP